MNASPNELSNAIASLVEAAGSGVVRVEAGRRGGATGAVWSEGVVVAADHAIESDENVEVGLPDGSALAATLAGRDPGTDLAVLRIPATGLTPAAWSDADGLKVGHLVAAAARPGRTVRAALGIVSALGPAWRSDAGGRIDRYVQTDLSLFRGFSGGLLVDLAGRVAGVNTSGLLRGIALTVPTSTVRRVTEEILASGGVRRGFLGVGTYPVRLPPSTAAAAGQASGLIVVSVQPDGPADRGGVLIGDVIVALDGSPVRHVGDLLDLLGAIRAGGESIVKIVRAGEIKEIPLKVEARRWP